MKGFQEKQMAVQKAANGKNEAAGKAFLAENKKKKGVTELENGLQYKILTAGTGKKPIWLKRYRNAPRYSCSSAPDRLAALMLSTEILV